MITSAMLAFSLKHPKHIHTYIRRSYLLLLGFHSIIFDQDGSPNIDRLFLVLYCCCCFFSGDAISHTTQALFHRFNLISLIRLWRVTMNRTKCSTLDIGQWAMADMIRKKKKNYHYAITIIIIKVFLFFGNSCPFIFFCHKVMKQYVH